MNVWFRAVALCWLALLAFRPAHAQPAPLELGQSRLGELSRQAPVFHVALGLTDERPVTLSLQSLEADFVPFLLVYDRRGDVVERALNPARLGALALTFAPRPNEDYEVSVFGADGSVGQFILSLNAANQDPPPLVGLRLGQDLRDQVSPLVPLKRYQVVAEAGRVLAVQVIAEAPEGGVALALSDEDGRILAGVRSSAVGAALFIPAGVGRLYILSVYHGGSPRAEGYRLSVSALREEAPLAAPSATPRVQPSLPSLGPAPSAPPSPTATPFQTAAPPPQVIIPADGECALTTREAIGVNIRSGPGVAYPIISGLVAGKIIPVTGRDERATWWQIEYAANQFGWVADSAVRLGGDCGAIGLALYPPPPADAPAPTLAETPASLPEVSPTP